MVSESDKLIQQSMKSYRQLRSSSPGPKPEIPAKEYERQLRSSSPRPEPEIPAKEYEPVYLPDIVIRGGIGSGWDGDVR